MKQSSQLLGLARIMDKEKKEKCIEYHANTAVHDSRILHAAPRLGDALAGKRFSPGSFPGQHFL